MMGNILDPNTMMFKADFASRHEPQKTIEGNPVVLVATQDSKRTRRKKKTIYIYHIQGTDLIVFNQSRNGTRFMKIAIRPENVRRFYETFVKPPVTPEEKIWLERYGYVLES
jgi:hypothetical protein